MYGSQAILLLFAFFSIVPPWFFGRRRMPRTYFVGLLVIVGFYVTVWLTGAPGLLTLLEAKPAVPPQTLQPFHPVVMLLVPVGFVLIGTGYTRWWLSALAYGTLGVLFVGKFLAWPDLSIWDQANIALTWPYFIQSFAEQVELWGN